MKTIILHGSPRKSGNTDTLAEHFIKGLKNNCKTEFFDFYTNDINVKPCQMCESCSRTEDSECIIKDDMQKIYSAFLKSNLVVWTVPIFWGYLTAQLKTVLDRMEVMAVHPNKYFKDKTFVVIIAYRHHYESVHAFFTRICEFFNIKLHFILYCCRNSKVNSFEDIPVATNKEKLEEAYNLGKFLGKNIESN